MKPLLPVCLFFCLAGPVMAEDIWFPLLEPGEKELSFKRLDLARLTYENCFEVLTPFGPPARVKDGPGDFSLTTLDRHGEKVADLKVYFAPGPPRALWKVEIWLKSKILKEVMLDEWDMVLLHPPPENYDYFTRGRFAAQVSLHEAPQLQFKQFR